MSAPAHGRPRLGILLSLTIAAVWLMALPGAASAAIGDITGMSCISKTATDGCSLLPASNSLGFPSTVAVAPDGSDVYVGSSGGVVHFRRAGDGSLSYASCVNTMSVGGGCPYSVPSEGSSALSLNAIQIAISPDGRFIYATSYSDALAWWSRDPATGLLTWMGCKDADDLAATNGYCGTGTTFGSGNFPAGSIDFPQGISVMPDGGSLYIADQGTGLLQAQLNTTTGFPTPYDCWDIAGDEAPGCSSVPSGVPMAAVGLAVASNSRDIYLSSVSPGGITHFQRSLGIYTTYTSCVAPSVSPTCLTSAGTPVFLNPGAIAVSGNNVFTHGGSYGVPDGTVGKFTRATNGSLNFSNCSTTVAAAGPCTPLPAGTLAGNIGRLLVSPDGNSVYTKQFGSPSALMRLTSELAFGGCIGLGIAACSAPSLPGPFAGGVAASAFSPDGKQIYQAGTDKIITYSVEAADTAPPASPGTPAAAKPRIRSIRKMRKGRHRGKYRVKIVVAQAGAISARFEGRLKRRAKIRSLSKLAKRSAARAATYTLYVKPSKTALKRKLKVSLVVTLAPPGYVAAKATKSVRLR